MKEQKIWAYLIHLSSHMWVDHDCVNPRPVTFHPELELDETVWRDTIDKLPALGINTLLIDVGDGVQYESHPEIACPGAWSKDKMKKELDYIRSLGMTPIPKLNFSTAHDLWLGIYERMVSTPVYYQVCEDLIREVCELFGNPPLFHLGMDEEAAVYQSRYNFCCMRQHDLWWHDSFFFYDVCEKCGTRPWVWADMGWHHADYLTRMPKSVLQSNWYYCPMERDENGVPLLEQYRYYKVLDDAGFEQVPTVSCFECNCNSLQTLDYCSHHLTDSLVAGYMTAPWYMTTKTDYYALLDAAQRLYDARMLYYPNK